MENKEMKKPIPLELDDERLNAVTGGGTTPSCNPGIMLASELIKPPIKDYNGTLIIVDSKGFCVEPQEDI